MNAFDPPGWGVLYPHLHAELLPSEMRPFVLLEVGQARIVPCVERSLSSWVHDHLDSHGQLAGYADNRPIAVRCVHPVVTCLEKREAIARAAWTAIGPMYRGPRMSLTEATAVLRGFLESLATV